MQHQICVFNDAGLICLFKDDIICLTIINISIIMQQCKIQLCNKKSIRLEVTNTL